MDPNFTVRVWLIAVVCRILYVSCACPAGWDEGYGDSCYKLGAAQGSWQKDKQDCESELLGHMLFVNNPAELNIVADLLKNNSNGKPFYIYSLWGRTLHQLWNTHHNRCFALLQIPTGYVQEEGSCDENYPFVCERTTAAVCAAQDLPTVDNSYNDGNATHDDRYTAGAVVTYTCHPGYALKDETQYTKTCTANHTFSGAVPECLGVCPLTALPVVPNSWSGGTSAYKRGEQPVYKCHGGYTFVQDTRDPLTCSADGTFTGTDPQCKNSSMLGDSSDDGCEEANVCCDYNCTGLSGCYCDAACVSFGDCCDDYESYCLSVVTCTPDAVPHSSKSPNQATYDYNTLVTYCCDTGYDHTGGDLTRMCTSSGYWTGTAPTCTSPATECTADNVQHSWKWPDSSTYDVGVSVDYYCNTGYYISSGDQKRTCISSGYWTGSSPTCSIVTCTPESVPNSSKSPNQASYDYNTAVTYSCDTGYYHSGGDLCITCTSSGYWTGSTPICTQCFPNATVIVDNPDVSIYVSALAGDTGTTETCTTAWITDVTKARLRITGCEIDSTILVSFSDRVTDDDDIYGGETLGTYTIKCAQIDISGIMRTVTQGLSASLSTVSESAISPTIAVESAMRSGAATNTAVTSATVGDELYWTLDIPAEYTGMPVLCTVYAGTDTSSTNNKVIINDGCSSDDDLVADFADGNTVTVGNNVRYWARFWAFKFYDNDYILIHCSVKFCPPASSQCDISCTPGRRRRALPSMQYDGADVKYGVASRVLEVYENEASGVTGQVHTLPCIVLGLALYLTR